MKSIDKFVLVLVASLALLLAGCGGGSSSTEPEETGPTPEEMAMQRAEMQTADLMAASTDVGTALLALSGSEPTQAQIDAVNEAIDDLEAALMAAADVGDAVKAGYQAQVSGAKNTVMNAEDALMAMKDEADKEAAAETLAMAKKLHAGLSGTKSANMVLADGRFISLSSTAVTVDMDGSAGGDVSIKKSSTAVPSLGGWAGSDYVKMDTDAETTDHVVLYSNQGSESKKFKEKHGADGSEIISGVAGKTGEYEIANEKLITPANLKYIKADDFATSGTKLHTKDDGDKVSIDGTFDGVSGKYSCEQAGGTACSSAVGTGGITLAGTWTFDGFDLDAMTQTPDSMYLVYGWWSHEAPGGVDVKAFTGGDAPMGNTAADMIKGKATYKGGAAGKYAVYNPLGDDSSAGAFTANAMLTADFTKKMISGELTDFMSGGESMDWEVSLNADGANIDSAGIGMTDGTSENKASAEYSTTTWTMGETSGGDGSGNWSGNFYHSNGGSTGDGNTTTTPSAVTGTFNAGYTVGGLHLGQMEGAFGADLDD